MIRLGIRALDPAQAIVITGMGVTCAAGASPDDLWESVARGICPAVAFTDPAVPDGQTVPACVVPESSADQALFRRNPRQDRFVQLALEAAGRAIADSGLLVGSPDSIPMGIMAGSSRGPLKKTKEMLDLARSGTRRLPPSLAAHTTLACLSGTLALAFRASGPCLTVSATCASSAYAIALAAQQILLGTAEVMLAGGADAPLQDALIRQVNSTGILGSDADPRRACRPFDVTRDGTLLGEGAAFLVLESLDSARRRGARIHAQLVGWALGSDPSHLTAPGKDGEGLFRVMTQALASAGLKADRIDHVNAHGTGTQVNDRVEVLAMRRVWKDAADRVPCNSTKPITGHCLGASSALEAIISILTLRHQFVPPTANCRDLDPDCAIDVVRGHGRHVRMRYVMSNSVGFWGKNASLIFGLPPESESDPA